MSRHWLFSACTLVSLGIAASFVPAQEGGAPAPAVAPLSIQEPAKSETLQPRVPERQRWAWNRPQAEITPDGDLKWKPQAFAYEAGPAVRYIDFEGGDDSRDGASKTTAWKHHPWDPAAGGNARAGKGPVTYVFKRGVVYRGALRGAESGDPANPIRLTSDPSWGEGSAAAVICGSERVTGWKQGADNADIPQPDKVWYADVTFLPRRVFAVQGEAVERLALARTPNWKVSDPEDIMSEWWTWRNTEWWRNGHLVHVKDGKIAAKGTEMHLGVDPIHLTNAASYYVGAVCRTEYGIVMGTPFPTRVEAFDAARKGVAFQGIWFGASEKIIVNNRYYLEDKPQYLDSPGEFWFERKGEGGRLYLRLPGDRDPNTTDVEAARHINLIDSDGMSNVKISGLSFRFSNDYWDLTQPAWGNKDVDSACIRVLGSAGNIRVTNCRFEYVNEAVRIDTLGDKGRADGIVIADNDIRYCDHAALAVTGSSRPTPPFATLGDVKVLRNNILECGMRPFRQSHGHTLQVSFPETMEVAGNILDRTGGAGLFLFGGKASGDGNERPFARNLVYDNKVTHALLWANDWGSIETWQGGPTYVFNNISGDPCGYWNWAYSPQKPNSARLGMAFYLDGAFKNYHFNNVAWGANNDLTSRLCNHAAFYEASATYLNSVFNNTVYRFGTASFWSPGGGKHLFLGNAFLDISGWTFMHGKLKEDKPGPTPAAYPISSDAYARNVFWKTSTNALAVFEAAGTPYATVAAFDKALEADRPLAWDGNIRVETSPVRDAERLDFRPDAGSPLIGHGAKMFVPWSLSRTVGEWNFRRDNADPTVLFDNHWYMTPYLTAREDYHDTPVNNLKAVNVTAADYVEGPTENWTAGALTFNGNDRYAMLSNAEMSKPFAYTARVGKGKKACVASGDGLATPDVSTNNLLIELYFRAEPGRTPGVLVAKFGGAGYQLAMNKAGGVTLALRAAAKTASLACGARVDDGKWHHVIAEVDRAARQAGVYVDGRKAAEGPIDLAPEDSLANDGDFFVGRSPVGQFFGGTIDFLRICRGTLADAKTTIEELYDWEFDGPFLRDLAGREPVANVRSAGAFEPAAK